MGTLKPMLGARSRFFRRALLTFVMTLVAATLVGIAIGVLLPLTLSDTRFGVVIPVVAVALLLLGLSLGGLWHGVGLARVRRLKPDALVFLGRREPSLQPDLPMYLYRKDVVADVADRWVIAVIDGAGMAAWSSGPRARELFVMQWSELGEVEAIDYRSIEGRPRFGISVDVTPYPTPLLVRVGYAMFGLQAGFDRSGTLAVCEAANGYRPGHPALA